MLTIVDGVTTAYPGDYYEYEVGSGITRQYYNGGSRVAMRVSGDPEPSNNGVFYMLGDHLGSTSITVDESGAVVAELRYKAWGETRYAAGDTPTTWRFTGQRQEESLGLYYYRARWYDPYLNRWTQSDTVIPDANNPIDYDRYAYVRNNPLRYSDPSGHSSCDLEDSDSCEKEETDFDICDYLPFLCELKKLSPLFYDTLGISAKGAVKLIAGIEVTPTLYIDSDAVRTLDPSKSDWGIFINYSVSVGASEWTAASLGVSGNDGNILDQQGVSFVDGNAGACITAGCFDVGATIDLDQQDITSIEYSYGGGQGFDVSAGASYSAIGIYNNGDELYLFVPIPILDVVIPPLVIDLR